MRALSLLVIVSLLVSMVPPHPAYAVVEQEAPKSCQDTCDDPKTEAGGVTKNYCTAMKLAGIGEDEDLKTGIAYTVAAGLCLTACAAYVSGVGLVAAPFLTGACEAAGLVGTGMDIYADVKLGDGMSVDEFWKERNPETLGEVSTEATYNEGYGTAVIGGAGAVAGAGATYGAVVTKNAAKNATQRLAARAKIAKDARDAIKSGKAVGKTGSDAAKEVSESAAKDAADKAAQKGGTSTAQKVIVCATAALYGTVMSLKWVNYTNNKKNKEDQCKNIEDMGGGGPDDTNIITNNFNGTNGPGKPDTGGGKGLSPIDHLKDITEKAMEMFTNPESSAASADPLLKNMPNRGDLAKAAKELGLDVNALAKKLTTSSPGAALSEMLPDLTGSMKSTLAEIDKLALEGKIHWADAGVAYASAGAGGTESKKGPNFGDLFGAKSADPQGTTQQLSFGKGGQNKLDPMNSDIWHSQFQGSIFQIISQKLQTNQNRVESLEWATPLNRALMGLPRKPASISR